MGHKSTHRHRATYVKYAEQTPTEKLSSLCPPFSYAICNWIWAKRDKLTMKMSMCDGCFSSRESRPISKIGTLVHSYDVAGERENLFFDMHNLWGKNISENIAYRGASVVDWTYSWVKSIEATVKSSEHLESEASKYEMKCEPNYYHSA